MMPPITHTSWKRVSNLANARPRTASGPSRCSRLSNPSRPAAAPIADRERGEHEARPSPPTSAPSSVKTAGSTSDDARITSSRTERRSAGATSTPTKLPT